MLFAIPREKEEASKLLLETFDEKEEHNKKEMDYSLTKKGLRSLFHQKIYRDKK